MQKDFNPNTRKVFGLALWHYCMSEHYVRNINFDENLAGKHINKNICRKNDSTFPSTSSPTSTLHFSLPTKMR